MSGILYTEWVGVVDGQFMQLSRWGDNPEAIVTSSDGWSRPVHCLLGKYRNRKYEPPFLVLREDRNARV